MGVLGKGNGGRFLMLVGWLFSTVQVWQSRRNFVLVTYPLLPVLLALQVARPLAVRNCSHSLSSVKC